MTVTLKLKNPQGLDEILTKLLGYQVSGDWDKDIPSNAYVGAIKKENVTKILPGKIGATWGELMEKYAAIYLQRNFEKNGWIVKTKQKENGFEYDLLGWEKQKTQTPDLHVEFHFPQPKQFPYHLDLDEKATYDMKKLERKGAKNKYLVIGIPCNTEIQIEMSKNPPIEIKLQEYKFRKTAIEKRK